MFIDFAIDPLDRVLSPLWRSGRQVDLASVSEMDLRYEYFWSRVRLVADETDLTAGWGKVPLLDFAATLATMADSLTRSGVGVMDLTESAATLTFVRRGDLVDVHDAQRRSVATCGTAELLAAVKAFVDKVMTTLSEDHPEIALNKFFRDLGTVFISEC
ncbi:hypothetical protein GCM10020218_018250 [Dactylosporangium vinaceum]